MNAGSIIAKCNCSGSQATQFQDQKYGRGMRVMNHCKKSESVRCTCCGREVSKRDVKYS